jgi:hypothetical protein
VLVPPHTSLRAEAVVAYKSAAGTLPASAVDTFPASEMEAVATVVVAVAVIGTASASAAATAAGTASSQQEYSTAAGIHPGLQTGTWAGTLPHLRLASQAQVDTHPPAAYSSSGSSRQYLQEGLHWEGVVRPRP